MTLRFDGFATFAMIKEVAALACAILVGTAVCCAAPVSPGYPDGGERAGPQDLFETELVFLQAQSEIQTSVAVRSRWKRDGKQAWETPVSLEYGLTAAWQVELESSFISAIPEGGTKAARGMGDLEFGTQYSLLAISDSGYHAAARFSVTLPTADIEKGFTEGFVEYRPAIVLARDLRLIRGAQAFVQIGLAFMQRRKEPADPAERKPAANELEWGVGFFMPFARGFASLELSGRDNRWNHGGEETEAYLTPGLTWKLQRLEAGVGLGVGLNRDSDRVRATLRLTREF